jgi:FkbM family methyltransferase
MNAAARVLRLTIRASRSILGRRALPIWRSIARRLPPGKAVRVATEVTAVFPLDASSDEFYTDGRPRWNQNISLRTNPRCTFARQFALTGWYEDALTRELLKTTARGLFVDVGAHHGYFSALWLSKDPQNTCLAIEPIPQTCALLEANLRPFGPRSRVAQACAGDEERLIQMAYDPDWPLLANIAREGMEVQMKPLERLLEPYAGQPIAVLKIDAEGWDVRILLAALDLFRTRRVGAVYWESAVWDGGVDPRQQEFVETLQGFGYVRLARPGLDMAFARTE